VKILRNHSFVIEKYVETTVSQYVFWHGSEGCGLVSRWEEYLHVSKWESGYPSVANLLKYLRYRKIGSEGSRDTYCRIVYAFCKYTDKLPDELVLLRKIDIEKLIEDFCYHKREKEWKSARTANSALFSLKTFFKTNGFKGNERLDVECFHQSVRERTRPEYIPTLEEARRMANVTGSLRDRAIIFFMFSTGLRNGTLRALLYSDVKDELEKDQPNLLIKVHKGMKKIVFSACKGDTEYCVFTSSEATEALKLYINNRRIFDELKSEEVLFCSEHNRLSHKERANKPLTARELQIIVKNAARKADIKEWKNVVPHCLRKTFETILRSQFADGGRLDLKTQEYFMGHILGGSMDTYFDKTKTDELRKEYAKLMFKPKEQAGVENLESLQAIAKTIGIDYTRFEELKKKELGRALNDLEKFAIIQEAFKQTAKVLKDINDSSPRATIPSSEQRAIPLSNQKSGYFEHKILSSQNNKKVFSNTCRKNRTALTQLTLFMMPGEEAPKTEAHIKVRHGSELKSKQLKLD
jgi:site-specific recombinase XerD